MKAALAAIVAACAVALPAQAEVTMGHPNVCSGPPAEPGRGGWVTVGFWITPEGTVRAPEVLDSSGFPDLDQQALECARNFHYRPAALDGKPVESPWRVTLRMGDPMAVSETRRVLS